MANEALVSAIKEILNAAKTDPEGGLNGFAKLFASADFAGYRPEEQRQALKLAVMAKRKGPPTPALIEMHRAAIGPLSGLVRDHGDPADYEMLGTSQLAAGKEADAATTFKTGLDLERTRNPDSDLCGRLLKLYSSI